MLVFTIDDEEATLQELRDAVAQAEPATPQRKTATNRMSNSTFIATETIRHQRSVRLSPMPRKAQEKR